jgi:hypothetical protein
MTATVAALAELRQLPNPSSVLGIFTFPLPPSLLLAVLAVLPATMCVLRTFVHHISIVQSVAAIAPTPLCLCACAHPFFPTAHNGCHHPLGRYGGGEALTLLARGRGAGRLPLSTATAVTMTAVPGSDMFGGAWESSTRLHFTQADCTAVAELAAPVAELVPSVPVGVRPRVQRDLPATHHVHHRSVASGQAERQRFGCVQSDHRRHVWID